MTTSAPAVVVTRTGAYADLPPGVCAFVEADEYEQDLLTAQLDLFARRPDLAAQLGANARAFALECHTLEQSAAAYAEFLRAVARKGALVLDGGAAPYSGLAGYRPGSHILRQYFNIADVDDVNVVFIVLNIIARDGGNSFNGTLFLSGANGSMQGSNYTDALEAASLRSPQELKKVMDFNPMGGGRIVRDKLWFYLTYREVTAENTIPGMFFNKNAGDPTKWLWVADPSVRGKFNTTQNSGSFRFTYQANPKNKFFFSHEPQGRTWIDATAATLSGIALARAMSRGGQRLDAAPRIARPQRALIWMPGSRAGAVGRG